MSDLCDNITEQIRERERISNNWGSILIPSCDRKPEFKWMGDDHKQAYIPRVDIVVVIPSNGSARRCSQIELAAGSAANVLGPPSAKSVAKFREGKTGGMSYCGLLRCRGYCTSIALKRE